MLDINFLHIPKGIRLISWATASRFIGWGFVEIYLPVFLLSFASNFTETGLLKSVYDIVFLASLPIISRLADRVSSKKIILSGLVLYPAIALCYFFAGVYGAVAFVIAARCINGLSYALDSVGKRTYMRRNAHNHVGLMFGYFETISNFWWLMAALASLFLLKLFPIHELFLLIIPTTIVAIILVSRIPKEPGTGKKAFRQNFFKEIYIDYRDEFAFIWSWNFQQKYNAVLYALAGVMFVVTTFFVPLVSFVGDHDYLNIFLLTAFAMLPYILGVPIGFFADRSSKMVFSAVILFGISMFSLIPFASVLWQTLGLVFLVNSCVYYSMLVIERVATSHERRAHMGSLSGAFLTVTQLAQVLAPIVLGLIIDKFSLQFAIFALAALGVVVAIPLISKRVKITA
jgi:MFS family permease